MIRVLITGSRDHSDWAVIESALTAAVAELRAQPGRETEPVMVVHGGARGADRIAGAVARRRGWSVEVHPADWDTYRKAAGHRRNAEMVAAGADICLAFPLGRSPGTRGCVRLAEGAGIPVRVFEVEVGAA